MVKKTILPVKEKQELTYEKLLEQYTDFINSLPDPTRINLPNNYWCNTRLFDYWQIIRHVELAPTDKVLDVGALHTFWCVYLSKFCGEVHATDSFYWGDRSYATNLMTVRGWSDTVELLGDGKINAYNMDLRHKQASFFNGYFDYITCISTIEHINEDSAALSNLMKMLKVGGKLFITTEYNETAGKDYSEADGSFYRVYTKETLGALLAGCNVTDTIINEYEERSLDFKTIFVEITK